MMNARAELYRALEDVYAIFLAQFGAYRVINGQIQFASQSATAQYLTASRALSEKAGRIEELDRERIALMRAQQEGWERFVRSGGDKP
jgi:hypothetical protein